MLLVTPERSQRRRALALSVSMASGACLALVLSWHMADTWLAWLAGVFAMFVMAWHERRLVSRQGLLRVDAQGELSIGTRSGWQDIRCWSAQASACCLALRLEGPQGVRHMTIWRDAVEPAGWRRLNLLAVRQQFNLGEPRPGGTA
ncbi:protein YgfX [Kerstersia sp.]|uniref:protein YgfX n=1 Tax=Kerstersia sp. TaxID=1930783 RepID=UPI003F9052BF